MTAQNLTKHTYSAVRPDGVTVTRTTTRAYEYVVFAFLLDGHYEGGKWIVKDTGRWCDAGWAGSKELAQKTAKKYHQVEIVPVNNPRQD